MSLVKVEIKLEAMMTMVLTEKISFLKNGSLNLRNRIRSEMTV